MQKILELLTLLIVSITPAFAQIIHPAAQELFGMYREGNFPVAQMTISADKYQGFVYLQAFRPLYIVEADVSTAYLPYQIQCCALSIAQLTAGRVNLVHVYIDPNPPTATARGGFIGPVETLIRNEAGDVVIITPPFIGRRATRTAQ